MHVSSLLFVFRFRLLVLLLFIFFALIFFFGFVLSLDTLRVSVVTRFLIIRMLEHDIGNFTKVPFHRSPVQQDQQHHVAEADAEDQVDADELLIRINLLLSILRVSYELALRNLGKGVLATDAQYLALHKLQAIFLAEL